MKVSGTHFLKNLEHNVITFKGDIVSIHSYDGTGTGVIRNEKNTLSSEGNIKIYLSGSDSKMLSKFSEIEIEDKEKSIVCKMGAAKLNIKKIADFKELVPNLQNLKEIDIDIELVKKAAQCASKKESGFEGVHIFDDCIAGSDKIIIYKATHDSRNKDVKLHVPTNFLKLINDSKYVGKLNDSTLCFVTQGELVYTNKYATVNESVKNFKKSLEGWFKLKFDELEKHLSVIASFTSVAKLMISGDTLELSALSETEIDKEYTATISIETNLSKYLQAFDVNKLLQVVKLFKKDTSITLDVALNTLSTSSENEVVYLSAIKINETAVLEVK